MDLDNWSSPVRAFSDSLHSANPVPCEDEALQWQPNLFLLDDGRQLGCVWSANIETIPGSWGLGMQAYFSVLDPDGKWKNHKISFGAHQNDSQPIIDGVSCSSPHRTRLSLPTGEY